MIRVSGLTKVYGGVRAVDDLTFDVESGKVTGFLGPNGAGKSTTMRMVLGLDRPTAGSASVSGRRYTDFPAPLREVGALLDAGAMHPGRSGRSHLRIGARSNGIPLSRVDEVIEQVGLEEAASRRVKGYSLGMRQRLGHRRRPARRPTRAPLRRTGQRARPRRRAVDPGPLPGFADEGRTVLVSSHLMSEMQLIADRVVVIGRGRLITDTDIAGMLGGLSGPRVRVRTPRPEELAGALGPEVAMTRPGPDELEVAGLRASEIGDLAHAHGIPLHHLAEVEQSLEDAYLSLTEGSVEHVGHVDAVADGARR